MILEDFEIVKKIFSLFDEGIVGGYDAFEFKALVNDSYIESNLIVTKKDVKSDNAETDYNGAALCDLLEALQRQGRDRGNNWCGIIMNYRRGGEVKIDYKYAESEVGFD